MHDHHTHGTTVVEERDGMSGLAMALIALAVIALLVWLFVGVIFDGGDTTIVNPGDEGDVVHEGDTSTETETETETEPTAPSP